MTECKTCALLSPHESTSSSLSECVHIVTSIAAASSSIEIKAGARANENKTTAIYYQGDIRKVLYINGNSCCCCNDKIYFKTLTVLPKITSSLVYPSTRERKFLQSNSLLGQIFFFGEFCFNRFDGTIFFYNFKSKSNLDSLRELFVKICSFYSVQKSFLILSQWNFKRFSKKKNSFCLKTCTEENELPLLIKPISTPLLSSLSSSVEHRTQNRNFFISNLFHPRTILLFINNEFVKYLNENVYFSSNLIKTIYEIIVRGVEYEQNSCKRERKTINGDECNREEKKHQQRKRTHKKGTKGGDEESSSKEVIPFNSIVSTDCGIPRCVKVSVIYTAPNVLLKVSDLTNGNSLFSIHKPTSSSENNISCENNCTNSTTDGFCSEFRASHRLKRLEEHFNGLLYVRKSQKVFLNSFDLEQHTLSNNTTHRRSTLAPSLRCKLNDEKILTKISKSSNVKCVDVQTNKQLLRNGSSTYHSNNYVKCSHLSLTQPFDESGYDLKISEFSKNLKNSTKCENHNSKYQRGSTLYKFPFGLSTSEFDVRLVIGLKPINLGSDVIECYDEFLEGLDSFNFAAKLRNNKSNFNENIICCKRRNKRLSHFSCEICSVLRDSKIKSDQLREINKNEAFNIDCECSILKEVKPVRMRETNGQPRGLLKKPNRPPTARKNRVVFDETRNEFFEADYIILIREDCAYDEEDEEPCTCGEHDLVRLCCEEGCQCNYTNEDNRTPQSPKFAPPMEFVDDAALSPPDGYKDNGLKNSLGGALTGHIFGAQHIQQLQVIQRLQQQRAAMLAARNSTQGTHSTPPHNQAQSTSASQLAQSSIVNIQQQLSHPRIQAPLIEGPSNSETEQNQQISVNDQQPVCSECVECAECAASKLQDLENASTQYQEIGAPVGVSTVAILPVHNSSPERRITQKEIIAGEERPKYLLQTQYKPSPVTERRIVREATEDITTKSSSGVSSAFLTSPNRAAGSQLSVAEIASLPIMNGEGMEQKIEQKAPPIPPKESSPTQISGILKGGKLWKQESITQSDDFNIPTSEDESNSKRSVRFITEDKAKVQRDSIEQPSSDVVDGENQINELIPIKKHSTLFTNALRPNSAVRQLFPSVAHQSTTVLTHEALRAFDESKRGGNIIAHNQSSSESDSIRRSIERNILRRSLIKKKAVKSDISLEERIKQLTCDIDESNENNSQENEESVKELMREDLKHRDSPAGEENPQKYIMDKSFSPSSSVSSSSSGSSSAYKKISDIFNRDKKQEKILEMEESPIVIIPQECLCPAAPDLGMGIQVPVVHTQIHRTPPRQSEPKRQFLSTLAPLTACVAGQKDDLSYYTLAASEDHTTANNSHFPEVNLITPVICNEEIRKVAPDVIAGTPGQEQDDLAAFVQLEANRTEKIKKRYIHENSNVSSDDEQNDYGFNKRPSVRGIKPKFSSTNEILQQMQEQLNQTLPASSIQNNNTLAKSYTLPKNSSVNSMSQQSLNPCLQNVSNASQQQQQPNALQQTKTAIAQQQTERTWSFYSDNEHQGLPMGYYKAMPTAFHQELHGQEDTLMYQNCQRVTMEQHYGHYAKSPTRRPESPPPLRNYHQTMVLIPYNAEAYTQFASSNIDPNVAQIHRQNILEYQQVTQQTIRVPISYSLPGMQFHLLAGRGNTADTPQYAPQAHQIIAPRYNFAQDSNMGFSERGAPEGAAAISHTDSNSISSPTSSQGNQQLPSCTHSAVTSTANSAPAFYAMNV